MLKCWEKKGDTVRLKSLHSQHSRIALEKSEENFENHTSLLFDYYDFIRHS